MRRPVAKTIPFMHARPHVVEMPKRNQPRLASGTQEEFMAWLENDWLPPPTMAKLVRVFDDGPPEAA